MRFRIDLKIFLFLILFYLTKQIEIYAMIMVFALIHELGHLLAGIILKMKPEKLEIMPFGVSIAFKIEPKDYNKKIKKGNKLDIKKIIVASAGPLTNLIIIIIVFVMAICIFFIPTIQSTNVSIDTSNSEEIKLNPNGFIWPTPGYTKINCNFGKRVAPTTGASTFHKGVDI